MREQKDPSSSTPEPTTQFGVLDLLLLMLSIGYICGLITLGQATRLGTDLVEWSMHHLSYLASVGLLGPPLSAIGARVLVRAVDRSPKLAPRLFLKMNLATMFLGQSIAVLMRMSDGNPLPIGGLLTFGALPLLPLWMVHCWLLHNKITRMHWSIVLCAACSNIFGIAYLMFLCGLGK